MSEPAAAPTAPRSRDAVRQVWIERLARFDATNNLSERTLRAIAVGRNNWGVIGSASGGETAAMLNTLVGTCKHLGIDPFADLREVLPGLFALGEKPSVDEVAAWLPISPAGWLPLLWKLPT